MNSAVDGAWFVGDGIFLFEVFNEVMEGSSICIFKPKVIDNEGELNRS